MIFYMLYLELQKNKCGANIAQQGISKKKNERVGHSNHLYAIEIWMVYKPDSSRIHIYMIRHMQKYYMPRNGSTFQTNKSRRKQISLGCAIYAPNAT